MVGHVFLHYIKENLLTEVIQNIILPVEKTIPGFTKHFIINRVQDSRFDTRAFFRKHSPTYINFSTDILQKHLKNWMHEELILFLPLITRLLCLSCLCLKRDLTKIQLKTDSDYNKLYKDFLDCSFSLQL